MKSPVAVSGKTCVRLFWSVHEVFTISLHINLSLCVGNGLCMVFIHLDPGVSLDSLWKIHYIIVSCCLIALQIPKLMVRSGKSQTSEFTNRKLHLNGRQSGKYQWYIWISEVMTLQFNIIENTPSPSSSSCPLTFIPWTPPGKATFLGCIWRNETQLLTSGRRQYLNWGTTIIILYWHRFAVCR